jgi:hypothetical protein
LGGVWFVRGGVRRLEKRNGRKEEKETYVVVEIRV